MEIKIISSVPLVYVDLLHRNNTTQTKLLVHGLICFICMHNVEYCFCRPVQCPLPNTEVQMQLSKQMLCWLVAVADKSVVTIYLEALATSIAMSVSRLINQVK